MTRNGYDYNCNILFSYCNECYILGFVLWRINLVYILMILGEECKLWSGITCSFFHSVFMSYCSSFSIIIVFLIFDIYVLSTWSYTAPFELVSCDFLPKILEKAVPENTPGGKCIWQIAVPGPKIVLLTKLLLMFQQLVDCYFHIIVVHEVSAAKMMFLETKEL